MIKYRNFRYMRLSLVEFQFEQKKYPIKQIIGILIKDKESFILLINHFNRGSNVIGYSYLQHVGKLLKNIFRLDNFKNFKYPIKIEIEILNNNNKNNKNVIIIKLQLNINNIISIIILEICSCFSLYNVLEYIFFVFQHI